MSEFFDGFVLRGAKTSPSNSTTSTPADSGVARDVTSLDPAVYPAGEPFLVEARADQYRAAILEAGSDQEEFLVWAANTGSLTTLEGPEWATSSGSGTIPTGTIAVLDSSAPSGQDTDGSSRVVLTDEGGRDIAGVVSLGVRRGGSSETVILTLGAGDFEFVSGASYVRLLPTATVLALTLPVSPLQPALSRTRGDEVVSVSYWVSAIRFWWTRNDAYSRRFGWNGATQKWEPYRGSAPISLGPLSSDGRPYILTPRPTTTVGNSLPGSSLGDAYASLRLGASPDASSYPIVDRTTGDFSGVRVVPDDQVSTVYNFAGVSPPLAGVVGSGSGKIAWNPAFVQEYEGRTLWYVPTTFSENARGVVGKLLDSENRPLFLAPVPGPGERPIVRIGNRTPLVARSFDTETELLAATISEGEVGFAISTGRLAFALADVSKADPGTRAVPNPNFDRLFLGAEVRYDGITLNLYPQPVKAPTLLVDASGTPVTAYNPVQEVFVPDARTLPGLGVSGILSVPDRLGNPPVPGTVTPRPTATGLVRTLSSGIGDTILFTTGRSVTRTLPIPFEDELPTDPYRVPGDVAYVALEKRPGAGSKVFLGSVPRKDFTGQPIYFRTGEFVPSSYADRPRLVSRRRDSFVLDGSERLRLRVGSVSLTWLASTLGAGTYTAEEVALSIDSALVTAGAGASAYALSGRIVIESDSGTLSVGFGVGTVDLSGCKALGFLPGWRAGVPGDKSATDLNWNADYGGEFGFYRSGSDLDGSQPIPDYRNTYRITDRVLTESIAPVSVQFLDYAPREDVAGYDEGVFFTLSAPGAPGAAPVVDLPLQPWEDLRYEFTDRKFSWISEGGGTAQVVEPIASINLGHAAVVPETLIAPLNGFIRLSQGGPFVYLEPGVDVLLPNRGAAGEAVLIKRVGAAKLSGAQGRFVAETSLFSDSTADFSTVSEGDRLKLHAGDPGSFVVTSVPTPTSLTVSPEFLNGDGGRNVSYTIFQGVAPGSVDPAIVADVLFQPFNHLAEEPFEIRVLTRLGVAGGTLANADAAKDIVRGRPIFVRVSQTGTDIPLTVLSRKNLGVAANDVLSVPSAGVRFSSGAFDLRVGTTLFTQGVNLLPVVSFSPDPGSTIEYLTTTGALKFGSTVLDLYAASEVWYVETLLSAGDLGAGQAEINPDNGEVALSSEVLIPGQPVFFVEQMSAEGTTDVSVNPILGSATFLANPIRENQIVEVTYYRAVPNSGDLYLNEAGAPVQIREFLPLFLRAEVATRISSQLYSFNPTNRTTDPSVAPVVYADSVQLTYGIPLGCTVDFSRNTISLNSEVPDSTRVTISYAVYEAFGGETSYTVSTPPVWRPPFRLAKDQSLFLLDGDRTADVTPNKLLRVGAFSTYILTSVFDPSQDVTTVTISPAPQNGVGSLNPGQNALSLLSDRPVRGNSAFLPSLKDAFGTGSTPRFEPVTKGQLEIKFEGDLTRYAVAGHVLELNSQPFAIAKGELSPDGRTTTITVTSPFSESFSYETGMGDGLVKISVRPIYPEGVISFLGTSPFLSSEPTEVVLFGETDEEGKDLPGRTLSLGPDYQISSDTGAISFTQPRQPGLTPGQSLYFARTDSTSLKPFLSQGLLVSPRVSSAYRFVDPPSPLNGREGGVLQATYTFESPDSFFVKAQPFLSYVGEVATDLQRQATLSEPSQGPTLSTNTSKSNSDHGRVGLVSERSNLSDRDRAARAFLGFYNGVVSSFEQIEETLDGSLVGERDGKLRLYVGKGDPWVPPGYEDAITGTLNPRNLWFEAWMSARRGLPTIRLLPSDPITDPLTTTTDSNGRPVGTFQDPASFSALLDYQEVLVKNDVDDTTLLRRVRTERTLSGFITFRVTAYGQYADLSEASPYSRLFPERTTGFTTTSPGLDGDEITGVPGVYSAGKFGFDPLGFLYGFPFSIRSTTNTPIGQLENPVLGPLGNIQGLQARDRLARARVWRYSPTGFADVNPASAGRPAIIATVLPLIEFPIQSDVDLPDVSKLASQSVGPTPTGLNDLLTGDPSLHTPPFASGMQLALGFPEGNSVGIGYSGTLIPVGAEFRYAGVFVDEVLSGCILTLKSKDLAGADVSITNPDLILSLTGPATGIPFEPVRGDTIYVVPGTGSVLPATSDPPTITELQALSAALPEYRTGTDLNFTPRTGELTDATLPSFSDPTLFGLKEITGQRPPTPLSTLEAKVRFQNGNRLPTKFPALEGERTLDTGDYSLPYYGAATTELELLGSAATAITDLVLADSPSPPPASPPLVSPYETEAVYPDETLAGDGEVSRNPATLATLTTAEDLFRGTSSGDYPPPPGHAGVGDVEPFDLLFIQAPNPAIPGVSGFPLGATGIHTVGALVSGAPTQIETPRFVSAVNAGFSSFSYFAENAISWVDYPAYATGIVVREDTTVAPIETTFDVSSVGSSSIIFDDGSGGGLLPIPIGGLNDVFAANGKGSQLILSLIDKSSGQFVPGSTVIVEKTGSGANILACSFTVSGDGGTTTIAVSPGGFYCFPDRIWIKTGTTFFNFAPFNPVIGPPGVTTTDGFHDFSISVRSLDGVTASVDEDRLSFHDRVDFRSALPRGFTHPSFPGGSNMECRLSTGNFDAPVYNTTGGTFATRPNSVNNVSAINAGLPFTFPSRSTILPSVNGVGTWAGNLGTLRVLGFEGRGNVPIEATDILFTAIPSSRQSESGPIFNGQVIAGEIRGPGAPYGFVEPNVFIPFGTPYSGSISNVEPGDVVVLKGFFDPSLGLAAPVGSGKTGTYLVRAAVPPTPTSLPGHRLDLTVTADSPGGWFDFVFPTVVAWDPSPHLEVSSLLPLVTLEDLNGNPIPSTHAFPPSGRVYIIVDPSAVGTAGSAVSAAYSALDTVGNRFLNLSSFQNGVGGAISLSDFQAAAVVGRSVSGMTTLPVLPQSDQVPPNLIGYTFWPSPPPGAEFFFGFRTVSGSRAPFGTATYDAGSATLVGLPPAAGQLAVYAKTKTPSTSFIPSLETPVYDNVAGALDVTNFNWAAIHGAGPSCLVPGDLFDARYHAKDGLYLEPSFPTTGNDLGAARVNVVDAANSLPTSEIGTRNAASYFPAGGPVGGSYLEIAQVEVLRIRRFHLQLELIVEALETLRFAYEIRRGIVQSFTGVGTSGILIAEPVDANVPPTPTVGGGATQLGDFTLPGQNIRSGDQVRFLGADGKVIAEAAILVVEESGKTLSLSKNSLPGVGPGTRFEVYLRSAPIPQEQSAEELLELATDQVLLDRRADLVAQTGGRVLYLPDASPQVAYDQSANRLADPDVDFTTFGIQPGDILVIDPAGELRGPTGFPAEPERGTRPFGDEGVLPRGVPFYNPGSPQRTDDNRGFYRVVRVTPTSLEVGILGGELAGNRSEGDVVFDDEYSIYPTVHGSNLSGTGAGLEGQMDLRPTAFADPSNSFRSNWFSIAPFSYRVIRPTSFLREETLELILANRERMLSWIEELRALFTSRKGGSYFVFQRDRHISDLGDPSDPADGSGVLFDAFLRDITGRTLLSPFTNTADCLSILDRRFWGLDFRLDYLRPPFRPLEPPYADFASGVGRPVLPDRIEEALQQRDRLRDSRWAWLTLRTDQVSGTLAAIRRFDAELPRRRAEQERLLAMVKGTENV